MVGDDLHRDLLIDAARKNQTTRPVLADVTTPGEQAGTGFDAANATSRLSLLPDRRRSSLHLWRGWLDGQADRTSTPTP